MALIQTENLAWYQGKAASASYVDLNAARWAYWANVAGWTGAWANIDIDALISLGLTRLGYPPGLGSLTDRLRLYEGAREDVPTLVPNEADIESVTFFSNPALDFKTRLGSPLGLLLSLTYHAKGGALGTLGTPTGLLLSITKSS